MSSIMKLFRSRQSTIKKEANNFLEKAEYDECEKRKRLFSESFASYDYSSLSVSVSSNTQSSNGTDYSGSFDVAAVPKVDFYTQLCNICWKSTLSSCLFSIGSSLIDFGSLWLREEQLEECLEVLINRNYMENHLAEIAEMAIFYGPLRFLKAISCYSQRDINNIRYKGGNSPVHVAVLSRNIEAFLYLVTKYSWTDSKNDNGFTAEDLCHETEMKKYFLLNSKTVNSVEPVQNEYLAFNFSTDNYQHVIQQLFQLINSNASATEILYLVELSKINVNQCNLNVDSLLHCIIRQGLRYLHLLYVLVKHFSANINLQNEVGDTCLLVATSINNERVDNCVVVDFLLCVLGADIDQANSVGCTPLHIACMLGRDDLVQLLLKRGADFNLEDDKSNLPDVLARKHKNNECAQLVVKFREDRKLWLIDRINKELLKREDLRLSDLNCTEEATGNTLLMIAVSNNLVRSMQVLLSVKQLEINAQNGRNLKTALIVAVETGKHNLIGTLLANGANPVIKDMDGLNALQHAVVADNLSVARELIKYKSTWKDLKKTLEMCKSVEMKDCIEEIRSRRQSEIITPVVMDCAFGFDTSALHEIFENGDDVNISTDNDSWPMYMAVENCQLDAIREFYELGGNIIRCHALTGNSLLHLATKHSSLKMVKFLLEKYKEHEDFVEVKMILSGIINMKNSDGQYPLFLAAEKGCKEIVQLLLEHGASTAIVDNRGQLYDGGSFESVRNLINQWRTNHTEHVMSAIKEKNGLEKLQLVFQAPYDHNLRDTITQDTPLMMAARHGSEDMLKFLLQSAVYKTRKIFSKYEHLHNGRDHGFVSDTSSSSRDDCSQGAASQPLALAQFLDSLSRNNSPNASSENGIINHLCATCPLDGCTVYHRAIQGSKDVKMLEILLSKDKFHAGVNIQDKEGLSLLHLACKLSKKKVVSLLCNQQSVDLHLLSHDNVPAEDMTKKNNIKRIIMRAKCSASNQEDVLSATSSKGDLSDEISSDIAENNSNLSNSTMDFDEVTKRFQALRKSADH